MNKKVSKYYKDITDVYFLQCLCTELRDFCTEKDVKILVLNHKCNIYLESLKSLRKDNEYNQNEILRLNNIINEKDKEIERLNNNWKVVGEDLLSVSKLLDLEEGCTIYDIEYRIKELKGSVKN